MHPFRERTPKRRKNRAECEHYNSYKDTLREDFNQKCGYCDDTDLFRLRNFTIDHFVPQKPEGFTHSIKPNYYYNLVYSCSFCNSAKSNKWATKDAGKCHDGKCGFVEPTTNEYTKLLKRDADGKIQSNGVNDSLAEYIIEELKLYLPVHNITWKLEKLHILKQKVQTALEIETDDDNRKSLRANYNEISAEIGDLLINIMISVNE